VSFLNLILNVFYHEKELKDSKKRRIIQRNSTFRNKQTNNRNFLFLKEKKTQKEKKQQEHDL
jgi:riboflavin synthase